MAEYIAPAQNVSLNTPVVFNASMPCNRGCVIHDDGTGIFILRGGINNPAAYQINASANIAVPEGGTVTAIALALSVNGEERVASESIFTPQAVNEYGAVNCPAIIKVPCGCCYSVALEYVDATTDDPAVTPTPTIALKNATFDIARIA